MRFGIRLIGTALLGVALVAGGDALASVESEIAFHRGVVAYGEGSLDEAKAAFEKVVAADPEDDAAVHYLGLIAQAQGNPSEAIALYERVLAVAPDDIDVRFDLGIAQLEAGQLDAARASFDQVLAAEPNRAQAHLFAGMADYRAGDYKAAVPHLDRAVELDPSLRGHARYYAGLSQAFLGDLPAAEGSFAEVEQSPIAPLARSASNLRDQLEPQVPRRWNAAITSGFEFDSNPLVVGNGAGINVLTGGAAGNQKRDYRGVFRARGSYRLVDGERFTLTAGYDGYWSLHKEEDEVDLQTHVGWATGGVNFDPFRFSLRTDYAYTAIDMSTKFRSLVRTTPSITYRAGTWGVSQLFYQFQNREFLRNLRGFSVLNRDGQTHGVGFNQFFFPKDFLPDALSSISYFRIGANGEFQDTDGGEYTYDAWEVSAGTGVELPFQVTFTTLYRFTQRLYNNNSVFGNGRTHRDDDIHRFTLEAVRPIGQNFEVSVASSHRFQDSDVSFYDYNRHVVGTYVTYKF